MYFKGMTFALASSTGENENLNTPGLERSEQLLMITYKHSPRSRKNTAFADVLCAGMALLP